MAGLDSVYLMGLRLGGGLSLRVAETSDDVRGFILWGCALQYRARPNCGVES